ncbi:TetR/AcrR family transcriptional regulator [Blastococcus sp. SYSU DS0552]
MSVRPSRAQIDTQIVDRAAGLVARHGVAGTSLQAIALAVGYSKAGLLHHFPSKEALIDAVLATADARTREALDVVGDMPLGAERDRRAVEVLVDMAMESPGIVSLGLSGIASQVNDLPATAPESPPPTTLSIFGIDSVPEDRERLARVMTALGGLLVATLAAQELDEAATWRAHVIDATYDALGHRSPGAPTPSALDQTEA